MVGGDRGTGLWVLELLASAPCGPMDASGVMRSANLLTGVSNEAVHDIWLTSDNPLVFGDDKVLLGWLDIGERRRCEGGNTSDQIDMSEAATEPFEECGRCCLPRTGGAASCPAASAVLVDRAPSLPPGGSTHGTSRDEPRGEPMEASSDGDADDNDQLC